MTANYFSTYNHVCFILILFLVVIIALYYKRNHITQSGVSNFFLPALLIKIFAGYGVGLIFYFYYGHGDTLTYFEGGQVILETLFSKPIDGLKMLVLGENLGYDFPNNHLVESVELFRMHQFCALTGLLSGNSYLGSSLYFSLFSFLGCWLMFTRIARITTIDTKYLAFAILFFPSVVFWSSGILKDTLVMGSLGIAVYNVIGIFYLERKKIINFIGLLFWVYFLLLTKDYVAYIFVLSLLSFAVIRFFNSIRSFVLKWLFIFSMLIALVPTFFLLGPIIENKIQEVLVVNFLQAALFYQNGMVNKSTKMDNAGNSYDLGIKYDDANLNVGSLIGVAPLATYTTLYKPYVWKSRKIIILISAIENLFLMIVTIFLLMNFYKINFFKRIKIQPVIIFFLIFFLVYATLVGIASGNYGSLSRYRIPCLPFFLLTIIFLLQSIGTISKPISRKELHRD